MNQGSSTFGRIHHGSCGRDHDLRGLAPSSRFWKVATRSSSPTPRAQDRGRQLSRSPATVRVLVGQPARTGGDQRRSHRASVKRHMGSDWSIN